MTETVEARRRRLIARIGALAETRVTLPDKIFLPDQSQSLAVIEGRAPGGKGRHFGGRRVEQPDGPGGSHPVGPGEERCDLHRATPGGRERRGVVPFPALRRAAQPGEDRSPPVLERHAARRAGGGHRHASPAARPFNDNCQLVQLFHRQMGPTYVPAPEKHPAAAAGGDRDAAVASAAFAAGASALLDGDAEKQVATKLGLSRHTVHQYVKLLYRELQVSSRGELLKFIPPGAI